MSFHREFGVLRKAEEIGHNTEGSWNALGHLAKERVCHVNISALAVMCIEQSSFSRVLVHVMHFGESNKLRIPCLWEAMAAFFYPSNEKTTRRFPELASLKPADYPSENCCSSAIRLRYGRFGYYKDGDLPFDTNYGHDPWRDIEIPVANVCGPVSVAVANHHGYFNADGAEFVRSLHPRAFFIRSWDSAHPSVNTLATMFSKAICPGDRDVFATLVNEETILQTRKRMIFDPATDML